MFRFNHEFSTILMFVLEKMDYKPSNCDLVHIDCDSNAIEFAIQVNAPEQTVAFINIYRTDNPKIIWVKQGTQVFIFQKSCGSSWDYLAKFDDIV